MVEETKEIIILEVSVKDGAGVPIPEEKKQIDALATSILGLQQKNKALREERKLLDTTSKEGIARIKEINSEIDKNDKIIKKNSSSLEKQRLNIGNYSGALDKLIPGLGATAEGIAQTTKASLAFIATPIGAVIAAIVVALTALVSYFKSSEEGADRFAKISAQVSAVLKVLYDRFVLIGGAIADFLSGDVSGGMDRLRGSFKGLGDELEREVALAGELAEILDVIEEMELRNALAISETENQIKKLIIASKNRTLSERERIDLLKQAAEIEKSTNGEILAIQLARISATARQVQADFSQLQSEQKAGETTLEFARRIIANEDILIDRRKELSDLLIQFNATQGQSLNLQEKLNNLQDQLADKEAERLEKQAAKALEIAEARRKEEEERAAAELEQRLSTIKQFEEFEIASQKAIYDSAKAFRDQEEQEKKDKLSRELADKNKAIQQEIKIERLKNEYMSGAIETLTKEKTTARIAANILFKQDAINETVINTKEAAVAAYKSMAGIGPLGPALGFAAALAVSAYGAARVAEIAGINFFARGGQANKRGITGGRSHAQGGTRYYGEDGHVVELERDENWYVLKKSASDEINRLSSINVKHGGASWVTDRAPVRSSYAIGGSVQTRANNGLSVTEIQRVVESTMANMPPIYVVAQDVASVLSTEDSVKQRARVL
jgi:hypothetical protein